MAQIDAYKRKGEVEPAKTQKRAIWGKMGVVWTYQQKGDNIVL